jgi:hypothetical protein
MTPTGLCACGCGNPTPIAVITITKLGVKKGEPRKYIHGHWARGKSGANHPGWKGGRCESDGYVSLYRPDHPRAKGGHVHEHVLIVEKALGKYLPRRARVHHVDECRSNNRNDNLVACEDQAYHMLLHRRMRALAACGDPNAVPCQYCGQFDRQSDMRVFAKKGRTSMQGEHRECARAAEAKRPKHTKRRVTA